MKVSVITVCFNAQHTIRDTIESVLGQDHPDIEYIVADGASRDGTTEIIQRYAGRVAQFTSEPDRGLYDAMNKAWKMATGDLIGFLNADDYFADQSCVRRIVDAAVTSDADVILGSVDIISATETARLVRSYSAAGFHRGWIEQGDMPPHPAFYVRRSVFERCGGFDLQFQTSADFDFVARVLYVHSLAYEILPYTLVKMRYGGTSTTFPLGPIRTFRDVYRACKKNRVPITPLKVLTKYSRKLNQFRAVSALAKSRS